MPRDTPLKFITFPLEELNKNDKISSRRQNVVSDVWISMGYKLVQKIFVLHNFYYLSSSDFLILIITASPHILRNQTVFSWLVNVALIRSHHLCSSDIHPNSIMILHSYFCLIKMQLFKGWSCSTSIVTYIIFI